MWVYSVLSPSKQYQLTLQLHPWQANPESFSTPWGVFSLEHGVNHKGLRAHTSTINVVALCQVPIAPGWGETVD